MQPLFVLLASMSVPKICLVIIVVGFVIWVITRVVPMNDIVKKIFIAVAVIGLVIWVLQALGLWRGSF